MTTDRLAALLREQGLDSTANQGYHGWRCEHPDRYGPCECFDALVADLTAAGVTVATTPAEGLDVERLARDIHDDDTTSRALHEEEWAGDVRTWPCRPCERAAAAIAREYGAAQPAKKCGCGPYAPCPLHENWTPAQPAPAALPPARFCDHGNQRAVIRMNCPDCGTSGPYIETLATGTQVPEAEASDTKPGVEYAQSTNAAEAERPEATLAGFPSGVMSGSTPDGSPQPAPDALRDERLSAVFTSRGSVEVWYRESANIVGEFWPAPGALPTGWHFFANVDPDAKCPTCRFAAWMHDPAQVHLQSMTIRESAADSAPDLRAAAQAVVEHRAGRHGVIHYTCLLSLDDHMDDLRAALTEPTGTDR